MSERVLVLGVGNLLLGDEGVGVHVARELERRHLPPGVSVVDGGTGGFHLLSLFDGCRALIVVDATMDGQPSGTVTVTEPRYPSEFPRTLSAHDVGLKDLVESAALLGTLPRLHLVTVSIDEIQPMTLAMTDAVTRAVPAAAEIAWRLAMTEADDRAAC